MNERIRELEAQCWEPRKHPASQAAMGDKFNTEKFAELIVRECVEVCEDVANAGGEGPWFEGYMSGVEEVNRRIKQHFGVEE